MLRSFAFVMDFLITFCTETLSATWAVQASGDVEFIAFFAKNDHFSRMRRVRLEMVFAAFLAEIEFRSCCRGRIGRGRGRFAVETRY